MPTRHQRSEQDAPHDQREREEMFTIAPEILAGGASPRRGNAAPDRTDRPERGEARQPDRRDRYGRAR